MKAKSGNRTARRYAKAVYLLARENRDEAVWSQEMEQAEAMLSSPEIAEVMTHPKIGGAAKWSLFETLIGEKGVSFRQPFLNFLKLLIQNQKIMLVPRIREEFLVLWQSQQGILTVELTSAVALQAQEREALRQKMGQMLGKDVQLKEIVDSAILGGAVIQIGDRIIDGSLRTKLQQLREAMVA